MSNKEYREQHMIDWLTKYDDRFLNNKDVAAAYVKSKGEDVIYNEGLQQAEPLEKEVCEKLAKYSRRVLKKALK